MRRMIVVAAMAMAMSALAQQPATPNSQAPKPTESAKPAQSAKPADSADKPAEKAAPKYESPTARLKAAKTVMLKPLRGNRIPFDVISGAMDGWGRYTQVKDEDKADLVIEISAPDDPDNSTTTISTRNDISTGKPEQSVNTSHGFSGGSGPITMMVRDKNKLAVWVGTENSKGALRKKEREDNLVDAAQQLFARFHDRVEPPQ